MLESRDFTKIDFFYLSRFVKRLVTTAQVYRADNFLLWLAWQRCCS